MSKNCACTHQGDTSNTPNTPNTPNTLSRRGLLTSAALGSVVLLVNGLHPALASNGHGAAAITPEEAMKRLKKGNARFLAGKTSRPHLTHKRLMETYKGGQHPFATIIACSDSRVPVEEVFDQGVGDIFTIRVAGNVVHTDETGSAEYGSAHLGTPLIVVMGHTKCGAVTAVVKEEKLGGNISKLVETIAPAVERSKAKGLSAEALIDDAIRENVRESINGLLKGSEEISKLVNEGKVKIAGAIYHLENGRVEWM